MDHFLAKNSGAFARHFVSFDGHFWTSSRIRFHRGIFSNVWWWNEGRNSSDSEIISGTKKPHPRSGDAVLKSPGWACRLTLLRQADMPLIRCAMRDTFREAVFCLMIPRVTPRMISGWACFKAACAAAWSPAVMASSTLRISDRMRPRRSRFTAVARSVRRIRFSEDLWCAMGNYSYSMLLIAKARL